MNEPIYRAGFVALVGSPNVGKSTLVNALVGEKVSIVSRKAQTTRRRILGIVSRPAYQLILVDSPGMHEGRGRLLDRALNASVREAAAQADVVVCVAEAGNWRKEDRRALGLAFTMHRPVLLVLNKIDRIRPRERLLPILAERTSEYPQLVAVVPTAARRGDNVGHLAEVLASHLPISPPLFPRDQITDLNLVEQAAETVREALIERLGDELPHATHVSVERHADLGARLLIEAMIWVERESQKGIVIGAGGRMIKAIGTAARKTLEVERERAVTLKLRVGLRSGWSRDARILSELGLGR